LRNKQASPLFYGVTGLAAIGLFSFFVRDLGQLIKYLFITAIVGAIFFFIARAVLQSRMSGGNQDEMRKYRQAVKQSKRKYGNSRPISRNQRIRIQQRKKRRPTHLTVIEGNKHRKKVNNDQASN